MEPKSMQEQIAELEALIERMKADLAKAREAPHPNEEISLPKPLNGA